MTPRLGSEKPKPTARWMYWVYRTVAVLLFVVLSFGVHAVVELAYLHWAEAAGRTVRWYTVFGGLCALPPLLAYGLLALGVLLGLWAGSVWWRWVYIEGRRWKRPPFHHAQD